MSHSTVIPFRVRIFSLNNSIAVPVTGPFDVCFWAVARALKGKPGLVTAMQAVVAAKAETREVHRGR